MKYRYSKFQGFDVGSINLGELMDNMSDALLDSGYDDDYYWTRQRKSADTSLDALRRALLQALLDQGLVSEQQIREIAHPDLPEPVRRTQPWGLGWRLNHPGTPDSWGDLLGRHVFGHTGSVGNVVWMDPRTQGVCILFTNYLRARAPWRLVHLSNAVAASFV